MELMQANHQWSTRPDDERFTSLTDLHAFTSSQRKASIGKVVSSRALTAQEPSCHTNQNGTKLIRK
jgi:hypothetical protein